ncbi:MAG: T9SS type A sorting domain-containing protein [Flavobacterium sp.]
MKPIFQQNSPLLLAVFFLMITGFTYSQSIWTNPIDATNPSLLNPYTTGDVKDSNITVSGIGRGSGIAANAGSGRYNAKGWTTSGSIDSDDYFSFTLTPNSGRKINFISLTYTLQRSNTGPTDFAIRSSLDNYAANIDLITEPGTTAVEKTISLSGAAFQNISASITFRIYGYNADGANGTASINDFTFTGQATTLGIDDIEPIEPGFRIFPNPTAHGLVRFNTVADIEVYDSLGKLLLSQKETGSLETINFVSGIYFIKTSEGIVQRLIVK